MRLTSVQACRSRVRLANPDRFMGQQATVDLAWQVDRHVLVEAGYVHTWTAGALRAVGVHDVDFTYLVATYCF